MRVDSSSSSEIHQLRRDLMQHKSDLLKAIYYATAAVRDPEGALGGDALWMLWEMGEHSYQALAAFDKADLVRPGESSGNAGGAASGASDESMDVDDEGRLESESGDDAEEPTKESDESSDSGEGAEESAESEKSESEESEGESDDSSA